LSEQILLGEGVVDKSGPQGFWPSDQGSIAAKFAFWITGSPVSTSPQTFQVDTVLKRPIHCLGWRMG
jgi:hypothetical protein